MRRATVRGAALVGLALVAACGRTKPILVDFSESPRQFEPKDYKDTYERWTRYGRVMEEVDVALEVWATFKSWEYRQAYIERYASLYSLVPADREALRAAQLEAARSTYEFHVTAQSADYKWNDLEKRNTAWRVLLLDALGHELSPESIKLLKLPDAYEREFFPVKTPFTRTYSVRFPIPREDSEFQGVKSGSLTLRFAGPSGHVDLVWKSL